MSSKIKLGAKEQWLFVKQLAFLTQAHIPLLESLALLENQTTSPRQRRLCSELNRRLSEGATLADSLAAVISKVSPLAIATVRVGETSGRLPDNLAYLAAEFKKQENLRRKIQAALAYPAIVVLATAVITSTLAFYIFPKITPVLESVRVPLPWTTRLLIGASHFGKSYWPFIIGMAVLVPASLTLAKHYSPRLKELSDRLLLALPLIGRMLKLHFLATISRSLSLLLDSGLTLPQAVLTTSQIIGNEPYRQALAKTVTAVTSGKCLSQELAKSAGLFPPLFSQLTAIGETTGQLAGHWLYLSELYENDLDDLTKTFSSLLEPFLMIIIGASVGFVALAIITPIYALTAHLTH